MVLQVCQEKRKGVAKVMCRHVPHLLEQHSVAHREDLTPDSEWEKHIVDERYENTCQGEFMQAGHR